MYQALSRVGAVDLFLATDPSDLSERQRVGIEASFRLVGCVAPAGRAERGIWRGLAKVNRRLAQQLADILSDRKCDYALDPRIGSAVQGILSSNKYHAVVIKSLSLAMKTGLPPNFPVVLDVDDVEFEWYESQISDPTASWLRKLIAARRLAQLSNMLPLWYGRYGYVWVTKKTDISYPGLQGARVVGVPFFTTDGKIPDAVPDSPSNRTILMVGSYHHRPNRDGLRWFVQKAWPGIRDVRPDVTLRIVGGGLNDSDRAMLCSYGAQIAGVVPDIEPEYAHAAFTIAPIWSGAGINVKVFESYLYGRACIATRFAYRGYEEWLPKGEAIAVCDGANDFVTQCVDLLDSVSRREKMVEAGRPKVLAAFSFERFAKVVADTLHDAEHHRRSRTTCA